MKKLLLTGAFLSTITIALPVQAQHIHHNHHGHNHASISSAPAGVMGDHMHEKGGWMLS